MGVASRHIKARAMRGQRKSQKRCDAFLLCNEYGERGTYFVLVGFFPSDPNGVSLLLYSREKLLPLFLFFMCSACYWVLFLGDCFSVLKLISASPFPFFYLSCWAGTCYISHFIPFQTTSRISFRIHS